MTFFLLLALLVASGSARLFPFVPHASDGSLNCSLRVDMKEILLTELLNTTHMYRYGPEHIGVADHWRQTLAHYTVSKPFHLFKCDWVSMRLNSGDYDASKSSPAVAGPHIYVGTDNGKLVTVSRYNGKVVAEYSTRPSVHGIHGSPAVDDWRVYVGAYDGYLYAFNLATSKLAWEIKLGNFIGSSPTLHGETAFIGVEVDDPNGGYLCGVNRKTGRLVFRSKILKDFCHATPSVDSSAGLIFLGDNSGTFSCWRIHGALSAQNSEEEQVISEKLEAEPLWTFKAGAGGDIKSTAAIYGENVYFTSWDSHIYALNKHTGRLVWKFKFEKGSMSSPSIDPLRGLVIVGSFDKYIYCIDSENGHLQWKVLTDGVIMSSATILTEQGIAVIGTGHHDDYQIPSSENNAHIEQASQPSIYVVDLQDGKVLQVINLHSRLTGVPIALGPFLYAFDHFGYLYSFSQQNSL